MYGSRSFDTPHFDFSFRTVDAEAGTMRTRHGLTERVQKYNIQTPYMRMSHGGINIDSEGLSHNVIIGPQPPRNKQPRSKPGPERQGSKMHALQVVSPFGHLLAL